MSHGYTTISEVNFVFNIFSSSSNFGFEREMSIIAWAAFSAKSIAVCLPIPEDAPVINTTFPLNLLFIVFYFCFFFQLGI